MHSSLWPNGFYPSLRQGIPQQYRGELWVGGHISLHVYDVLHHRLGFLAKQEGSQWFKCLPPYWLSACLTLLKSMYRLMQMDSTLYMDYEKRVLQLFVHFEVLCTCSPAWVHVCPCLWESNQAGSSWLPCVGGENHPELLINSRPGPQSTTPIQLSLRKTEAQQWSWCRWHRKVQDG